MESKSTKIDDEGVFQLRGAFSMSRGVRRTGHNLFQGSQRSWPVRRTPRIPKWKLEGNEFVLVLPRPTTY